MSPSYLYRSMRPRLDVEANARQYYPAESAPEAARYPSTITSGDGWTNTAPLTGRGHGYALSAIARPLFHAPTAQPDDRA